MFVIKPVNGIIKAGMSGTSVSTAVYCRHG